MIEHEIETMVRLPPKEPDVVDIGPMSRCPFHREGFDLLEDHADRCPRGKAHRMRQGKHFFILCMPPLFDGEEAMLSESHEFEMRLVHERHRKMVKEQEAV